MRTCEKHNCDKIYKERTTNGRIKKEWICKFCTAEKSKTYRVNNILKYKQYKKEYYQNNKDYIINKVSKRYQDNKEKILNYNKLYHSKNKNIIAIHNKEYRKTRIQNDFLYKLKRVISGRIRTALKTKNALKSGKSIKQYLTYTIQELKDHLEKQFEPWMTWDNWGVYDAITWDDNDPLSWKWQIDHIIPHSTFKYTSMEDQSFKECWALSNLRPLSAKQNLLKSNN